MMTLLLLGPRPSGNLLSAAQDTHGPALTSATSYQGLGTPGPDGPLCRFETPTSARFPLGAHSTRAWQPRLSAGFEQQGLAERGQGGLKIMFLASARPWGSPVVKHFKPSFRTEAV